MINQEQTIRELFDVNSKLPVYSKPTSFVVADKKEWDGVYEPDFIPEIDSNYCFNPDDLRIVIVGFVSKIPTYLYGNSGVGKTSMIEQFCARTRRPFMRVQHTVGLEESNVVGQWVVKNGETVFELGPLPYAMLHGMVYCADEYDFAEPAVLSIYQSVLEGKPLIIKEADAANRVIRPHPQFRFFATGNTNGAGDNTGNYQGTRLQNVANYERFGIVHKVNYLPEEIEKDIILKKTPIGSSSDGSIQKGLLDSIIKFAKIMRDSAEGSNPEVQFAPSIRVLVNVANLGWTLGDFRAAFKLAYINRMNDEMQAASIKVLEQYIPKEIIE